MPRAKVPAKETATATVPAEASKYTPTEREVAALERYKKRRDARRKFPKLASETNGNGVVNVRSDHPDEMTAQTMQHDALGIVDSGEFTSLVKSVFNFTTGSDHKVDGVAANEAFQLIAGMEPRNTTEALLATQMAAVHLATMDAARRMHRTPLEAEIVAVNSKVLNNLARTFAAQVEAMKKLKGGGQQKVTVEHKHYYLAPGAIANSQAVLGDVSQGRGTNEIEHQPHERGIPERTTMHSNGQADGLPLSGAGSEWLEGVPLPWGTERGTDRPS